MFVQKNKVIMMSFNRRINKKNIDAKKMYDKKITLRKI